MSDDRNSLTWHTKRRLGIRELDVKVPDAVDPPELTCVGNARCDDQGAEDVVRHGAGGGDCKVAVGVDCARADNVADRHYEKQRNADVQIPILQNSDPRRRRPKVKTATNLATDLATNLGIYPALGLVLGTNPNPTESGSRFGPSKDANP
jgi:hypothetical protein